MSYRREDPEIVEWLRRLQARVDTLERGAGTKQNDLRIGDTLITPGDNGVLQVTNLDSGLSRDLGRELQPSVHLHSQYWFPRDRPENRRPGQLTPWGDFNFADPGIIICWPQQPELAAVLYGDGTFPIEPDDGDGNQMLYQGAFAPFTLQPGRWLITYQVEVLVYPLPESFVAPLGAFLEVGAVLRRRDPAIDPYLLWDKGLHIYPDGDISPISIARNFHIDSQEQTEFHLPQGSWSFPAGATYTEMANIIGNRFWSSSRTILLTLGSETDFHLMGYQRLTEGSNVAWPVPGDERAYDWLAEVLSYSVTAVSVS